MHASSQPSVRTVEEAYEPVLRGAGPGAARLGDELFTVLDALDGSGSLRRALTDPARGGDAKAALVASLLGGKVDDRVAELLQGLARVRWATERGLLDEVERLAVVSVLAGAESEGSLERVEDELFRLERVLVDQRELRQALTDRRAAAPQRRALVHDLLGAGRVHEGTLRLVERVAVAPRGRSVASWIGMVLAVAAARREVLMAEITSAVPLTAAQVQRLTEILERAYGRPTTVQVAVEPGVIGGIRVQVGSELVDATVLARLDDVRRRLAG
ncbi:MAG: F0F1 ATP synthase subunit delta [Actinotalea sp.]|nr:F0F1 ATP synthase subunit delta [Actinotalea sp.]